MIYKTDDGRFVISSGGLWLPGSYEDERAARYAFRFPDETLKRIQESKNSGDGSAISFSDLKAATPPPA